MTRQNPKLLITGGAGFIGSEFVRQCVDCGWRPAVVDCLTYAGDRQRLAEVKNRIRFHRADIRRSDKMDAIFRAEEPDILIHFATETHVDRSILDAKPFIETNIHGTQVLIETALRHKTRRFVHISTDEVYGEIHRGSFDESAPLNAGNPYSASKAAADLLIQAAIRTFHLPAVIIRPSNNYGPWQYPEKFIPVVILKAIHNHKVPVYGQGRQRREWLHVSDCARAIRTVMQKGRVGQIYNVSSHNERPNLRTARNILRLLDKPASLIQFVKDRPGHDFRYCLNCDKLKKLGWQTQVPFDQGLRETVRWYGTHMAWTSRKRKTLEQYWKKVYKPKSRR